MDAINNNILNDLGIGPVKKLDDPRKNNAEELGVGDFMTLMLAQIQNQDPFEPMQSGDFISQMAAFGTVSGIEDLQKSFNSLSESMFSNQALEAASLIGRNVQVATDTAAHINGGVVSGAIELPERATWVTVSIYDQKGVQVDSINFNEQAAGVLNFAWEGKYSDGASAASGLYNVVAEASIDGSATAMNTYLDVSVGSVSFVGESGGIELQLVNGDAVAFSKVREIR